MTGHSTPSVIDERANPPGQPTLRYRTGVWSSFRERMIRRLGRQPHSPDADPATAPRPLAALTTRAGDDGTIALVDATASVCDVLTFYGERIVNEGYLRTATETRSVTEIARSIGYRPDPGLAALTTLVFTIDPQVGGDVVVPFGQPVLSVPGPGELPHTFETTEEVIARHDWNAIHPSRSVAHPIVSGTTTIYLAGIATGLKVGDPIAVLGAERDVPPGADVTEHWDLRVVTAIETFNERDTYAASNHTVITLDHGLGDANTPPAATAHRVVTFGARAGLFGGNAPDVRMMSADVLGNTQLVRNGQWRNFALADDSTRTSLGGHVIDLDQEVPAIVAGGWVCLHGPTQVELYRVTRANPAGRAEFSLTGRVTRLFLDTQEHLDDFGRRSTTVLCASRELAIAPRPDETPVEGFTVALEGAITPMPAGRRVVVTGRLAATGEAVVVESTVAGWTVVGTGATVELTDALPAMARDSVLLLGNVAAASHGATVRSEVLGRGDAALANQQLELRRRPLTWLPGAAGATSSLRIRVAGVDWQPTPTFFDRGPNDRAYTVTTVVADDPPAGQPRAPDRTIVTFGDGRRGARLPSGVDNVVADYRAGLGVAGNVGAGQLTLLQERPAAVRAVHNPAAAFGGTDPAPASEIRRLAPLDVLTLGRLVSVTDYEDHAGTFPGVGKARATALWDGHRSFIHVTVAEASGSPLADTSPVRVALLGSLEAIKDPGHRVVVTGHVAVPVTMALRLRVEPGFLFGDVSVALAAALTAAFGFAARTFGQALTAAEVSALAHAVPGVRAVDIDRLHRASAAPTMHDVLPAADATWDGVALQRAELLLVTGPDAIVITVLEDG